VDLDGDGYKDLLSGSYSRMDKDMAGTFQVLYGKKDGTFRKAEELKGTDGEPLIIPTKDKDNITEKICTRPFAVDWDGDGHLDLVTGNFTGTFYWFKGEGKGKFAPKPEVINAGDKPLKIEGVHSDPFVVDWDGDGDLDIVSGSSDASVRWAENKAGKGKPPVLEPFQVLVKEGPGYQGDKNLTDDDLKRPTYASRVWVEDVNGDGKLDLLVGDSVTLTSRPKGLSEEDAKKKQAEWQAATKEALAKLNDPKADEETRKKASEEYSKLYQRRSEFILEDRTGFVWLYLQK